MDFLVFRLYGSHSAWGDVAVGERRRAGPAPTKSGVLGLVAACLGIDRGNEAELLALNEDFGFAAAIVARGTLSIDYHTAQYLARPKDATPEKLAKFVKKHGLYTRRNTLDRPRDELKTTLSLRDYFEDAMSLICIWDRGDAKLDLATIGAALERPHFAPYLGRRACPLALPMLPRGVSAADPVAAFAAYCADAVDAELLEQLGIGALAQGPVEYHYEGEWPTLTAQHTRQRRDRLRSRSQWLYGERQERVLLEGDV